MLYSGSIMGRVASDGIPHRCKTLLINSDLCLAQAPLQSLPKKYHLIMQSCATCAVPIIG